MIGDFSHHLSYRSLSSRVEVERRILVKQQALDLATSLLTLRVRYGIGDSHSSQVLHGRASPSPMIAKTGFLSQPVSGPKWRAIRSFCVAFLATVTCRAHFYGSGHSASRSSIAGEGVNESL